MIVKALSIRQPWAWFIVQGFKDIENRSWPTRFRGRFLIHAARTVNKQDLEAMRTAFEAQGFRFPAELPSGGIVGEAVLVDCVTASASPWFEGPYGFVLEQARPVPFQALPGRLKFFDVPLEIVEGM